MPLSRWHAAMRLARGNPAVVLAVAENLAGALGAGAGVASSSPCPLARAVAESLWQLPGIEAFGAPALGTVQHRHGAQSDQVFALRLAAAAIGGAGTAGPVWLAMADSALLAAVVVHRERNERALASVARLVLAEGASMRMRWAAHVAAVGETATLVGILPFRAGEAARVVVEDFAAWCRAQPPSPALLADAAECGRPPSRRRRNPKA